MIKRLFSIETKANAFFRPIDWTAFWSATAIAFGVYLVTLGPSVGLEDSGELATAGDHLGVPHPPGYPFWTLCSWIFCRLFSWVTYQGQPTPAWAISCLSAVFGALAAGCAAMLICRSASDMLDTSADASADSTPRRNAVMAFAAGLGGSLVFAFSPVEWSQSTIVEIYSLNALFLMAVFLLSYRWMRKPSDKILWLTAFIFGLGLTNYQVLLFAIVPIAIIIFLRDIKLFRDTLLLMIPVGLTAQVLQIGCMLRANSMMSAEVINKYEPILKTASCPNEFFLWTGVVLLVAAPFAALLTGRREEGEARAALRVKTAAIVGGAGVACWGLAALIFNGPAQWTTANEQLIAPLLEPTKYAFVATCLAGSFVAALAAVFAPAEAKLSDGRVWKGLAVSGACALAALMIAASLHAAGAAGYQGEPFAWGRPTLILAAGLLALFALTLCTPRGLAYAIPVAGVQLTVFVLLSKGAMNGLTNPHSWWFVWPIVWNMLVLGLGYVALPKGRSIAPATFFAELGVSFYVYMPIVSDLRNPPMNWGYPRTWEGFKHAITRGQYEAIKMPDLFSASGFSLFLKQLGFYFADLRLQFTLVAASLALIPFAFWRVVVRAKDRVVEKSAMFVAAFLYLAVAALVVVFSELFEDLYAGEVPGRLDKILLAVLALMAVLGLAAIAVRQTCVVIGQFLGRPVEPRFIARSPVRVTFGLDDVSQQWLIALGACFAVMSLLLIALAGVKGDIQDGFIQKVKFISSHGIFSLWIGYGLAVGLVVANRVLGFLLPHAAALRRNLLGLAAVAAAAVCLIPIYENYTNEKLVFAMGCAEQNGHTFGWQFGNYQLRGAQAIREELSADEEPLPNPQYPPAMDFGAVFFGGTDPGRFVPTYMIYSANVRPDVYLITQNALADDTYMSVERDLYGDDIWIPSKEDSAESFNIYVSEVKSGKRNANADLKIENGRVQVTGALGVMEINGILTKMMFDHERLRRAFYVEESYVIRWMYPYLAPHGLIMKIRKDPGPIAASNVTDDMEFWDWYVRRLLRDPAFRRDFAGQKSFSKLRAAIAGLYANQHRMREANVAFAEACLLYPASPEASFRYIQEVLMPYQQWAPILDILDYTDRVDPNNARTSGMRDYIRRFQELTNRVRALEAKRRTKEGLSLDESLSLAEAYASVGQTMGGAQILERLAKDPQCDRFGVLYQIAMLYQQCQRRGDAAAAMRRACAKMPANLQPGIKRQMAGVLAAGGITDEALTLLNDYLREQPKDVRAWLDLCRVQTHAGRDAEAQQTFIRAYQLDANATMDVLQGDERMQKTMAPLFRRK